MPTPKAPATAEIIRHILVSVPNLMKNFDISEFQSLRERYIHLFDEIGGFTLSSVFNTLFALQSVLLSFPSNSMS